MTLNALYLPMVVLRQTAVPYHWMRGSSTLILSMSDILQYGDMWGMPEVVVLGREP